MRKWYTPEEVAKSLGVCHRSVSYWIRSGKLAAVKTGKRAYHVTPEAILAMAHARAHAGRKAQSG